jgi:EAL domain-containing protein (putative c-di-GMP-specific phosphodiesterase class I)
MNFPSHEPTDWMDMPEPEEEVAYSFELVDSSADCEPEIDAISSAAELRNVFADLAGGGDSLDSALELVVQEVCRATGWPIGHVFKVGRQKDRRVIRTGPWSVTGPATYDVFREATDAMEGRDVESVVDDGGLIARAIDAGAYVVLEDLTGPESSSRAQLAWDSGLVGAFAVPVFAENEIVAVVEFFSDRPVTALREVEDTLKSMGRELGHLASKERLRDAVRRAARHARELKAHVEESPDEGWESARFMYDPVTELPLEDLFRDRVNQAIRRRSRQPDEQFAVMLLELTGLSEIKRRGGNVSEVLLAIGRRVGVCVRPADTVARLGDRLGILLEGIDMLDDAVQVANRMLRDVGQPVPIEDTTTTLSGHIGLVLGRTSYDRADALLHDAQIALRSAASRGTPLQVFDFAAHENAEKFLRLEGDLRRALEREEFYLEYQPIVSLDSGRITGLEAFIRWKHPERGLIPPATFVPVAESSPFIRDIGFWVIEQACAQVRWWQDRLGDLTPPVGINVTARQLYHDEFPDRVRDILELNSLSGDWIRFDIAESDLMQDASRAAVILSRLHGMGIKVAIDDFGTGYSSLSELHYFPADTLKIDRSFVSRPLEKQRRWGVAQTIVELAKILDMEVIAEGVETREQFQYLRQLGCGQAQGYLFSGPVGAEDAADIIRDGYPLDLSAPHS